MTRAFISVGSNISPKKNIKKSLCLLSLKTRIIGISTVYLTAPEGRPEQSPFYNLVVEIETEMFPEELKYRVLKTIEAQLGRVRTEDRYAPRTIDLDLILYDELVVKDKKFNLPDPDILRRPFLAFPLDELAPTLVLPGSGLAIKQVLTRLPKATMKRIDDFTGFLKREVFLGCKS